MHSYCKATRVAVVPGLGPVIAKLYLFNFHIMYKSQFQKIDPWFCGPGSRFPMDTIKSYILKPFHLDSQYERKEDPNFLLFIQ